MKKVLILLTTLAAGVLAIAQPAYADSGACSYHNGVNCNLVSQLGYAVCNDGFISLADYFSMQECQTCVYPASTGAPCDVGTLQNEENQALTALNAQMAAAGIMGGSTAASSYASTQNYWQQQINACQAEAGINQVAVLGYNQCVAERQQQVLMYQQRRDDYNKSLLQQQQEAQNLATLNCDISDIQCLAAKATHCRTESAWIDFKTGECYCADGFQFNRDNSWCVPVENQPTALPSVQDNNITVPAVNATISSVQDVAAANPSLGITIATNKNYPLNTKNKNVTKKFLGVNKLIITSSSVSQVVKTATTSTFIIKVKTFDQPARLIKQGLLGKLSNWFKKLLSFFKKSFIYEE